jgi:hypothetical protein
MAKTRTTAVKIVRVPSFSATAKRQAGAVARRGFSAAGRAASSEKHTIAAVAAAATLGFMQRSGVALPKFDALGTAGTYGLIAWAGGRFMRSPVLSHIATGLMSISAFQLAAGQTLSGEDGGAL